VRPAIRRRRESKIRPTVRRIVPRVGAWFLLLATGPVPFPAPTAVLVARESEPVVQGPARDLPLELRSSLESVAETYADHALRFAATEVVRWARYGKDGEATRERSTPTGYVLVRNPEDGTLEEHRDGKVDAERLPVPPAYEWTLLFHPVHRGHIDFHDEGFESLGFRLGRRIGFRGALPYIDGTDVREWEGTILLDDVTLLPIELDARPRGQAERLRARYLKRQESLKISVTLFGGKLWTFRTVERPLGQRIRVRFAPQANGLALPVEYRIETFEQVARDTTRPRTQAVRTYRDYRFFRTETEERLPKTPRD
jgi:hypothetical protein